MYIFFISANHWYIVSSKIRDIQNLILDLSIFLVYGLNIDLFCYPKFCPFPRLERLSWSDVVPNLTQIPTGSFDFTLGNNAYTKTHIGYLYIVQNEKKHKKLISCFTDYLYCIYLYSFLLIFHIIQSFSLFYNYWFNTMSWKGIVKY